MRKREQIWVDPEFKRVMKKLFPNAKSSRARSVLLTEKLEEMLYGIRKK